MTGTRLESTVNSNIRNLNPRITTLMTRMAMAIFHANVRHILKLHIITPQVYFSVANKTTSTPFTVPNIFSVLQPVAPNWKKLGEALSVDEDDIDEIYTNNETDEDCLHELIERFIVVHHNWEDVATALRKKDKETLVLPCKLFGYFVLHFMVKSLTF